MKSRFSTSAVRQTHQAQKGTRPDGWDLCRELRVRGYAPAVMISMSAFQTGHEAEQSAAAGCCAHLVKPFIPEALADLLQKKVEAESVADGASLEV